jgi:hypothetical protein
VTPVPVAAENAVAIAVIALVFIVGGYVLLAWLWYVLVRKPSREERAAQHGARDPQDHGPDDDRDGEAQE